MEPIDYLRSVRRYWMVVVAAILVAVGAAWLTRDVGVSAASGPTFQAKVVFYSTNPVNSSGSLTDPQTAAQAATLPPIPNRVADDIGFDGRPQELASRVTAEVDQKTSLLTITVTDRDPHRAELIAGTFGDELQQRLTELAEIERKKQIEENQAKLDGLKDDLKEAKKEAAKADQGTQTSSNAQSQQSQNPGQQQNSQAVANVETQISQVQGTLNDLQAKAATSGFEVLSPAQASPADTIGFSAPRSFTVRAVIAAIIGLLGGVVLALILGRFDTRLRTKASAEQAFRLPILAEVPVTRRVAKDQIVTRAKPASRPAEAYRILAAEVLRGGLTPPGENGDAPRLRPAPRALMVTSAGPGDGKSTVVANLASSLAETGKRVIVLSCDFHRPGVHRFFGVPNDRGLTDALSATSQPVLNGFVQPTSVDRVSVIPSGPRPRSASELLSSERLHRAVTEALEKADIVLIDTPPVLVASDATLLVPEVDAVLVVARAGKTKQSLAERTRELLERLGAPIKGVVLNRATELAMPRGYRPYTRSYRAEQPERTDKTPAAAGSAGGASSEGSGRGSIG